MKLLLISFLVLAANPGLAQSGGSDVTGRWGGADGAGPNYHATIEIGSSGLHLRFYQSDAPDPGEADLLFDNPAIIGLSAGAASVSMTPQRDGSLEIDAETKDEVAAFGETLYLLYTDNQVSVIRYIQEDRPTDGSAPQVICDVDLQSGQAIWADEQTSVALPPTPSLNAAAWTTDTAAQLGLCPSYE